MLPFSHGLLGLSADPNRGSNYCYMDCGCGHHFEARPQLLLAVSTLLWIGRDLHAAMENIDLGAFRHVHGRACLACVLGRSGLPCRRPTSLFGGFYRAQTAASPTFRSLAPHEVTPRNLPMPPAVRRASHLGPGFAVGGH